MATDFGNKRGRKATAAKSPLLAAFLAAFAAYSVHAWEPLDPSDWPMLAHDPPRSGSTPAEIGPPFVRKWYRLFSDEGLMAGVQPMVAGGNVYIGTMRGRLHAIDEHTGETLGLPRW
ncbi:MAG: PQQ-binding-like beta-propeller repeat protein [Thermoguttaceae bacterium]|nr:PQQ-binding-like beta-propeller repeat protein [Thermoguttaceae bacterium]